MGAAAVGGSITFLSIALTTGVNANIAVGAGGTAGNGASCGAAGGTTGGAGGNASISSQRVQHNLRGR
jgi:hypothetical protein